MILTSKSVYLAILGLALCIAGQQSDRANDQTENPFASGIHVVRATLARIRAAEKYATDYDRSNPAIYAFMRNVAFVETRYGSRSTDAQGGGIWNVNEMVFDQTKGNYNPSESSSTRSIYQVIMNYFCIDWSTVIYYDLKKPLYSALAVRIMMDYLLEVHYDDCSPNKITGSNQRSGECWAYFQPESVSVTRRLIEMRWINPLTEKTEKCDVTTDLVFILDSSGSIQPNDYNHALQFAANFTKELDGQKNRVGVILIGDTAQVAINLRSDISMVHEEILNLPHLGYLTNTADALCKLKSQLWRPGPSILRLAIVLTDGRSNGYARGPQCNGGILRNVTKQIHEHVPNIFVFAIGVGPGVSESELQLIASHDTFVDHVESYDVSELKDTTDLNTYQICFETSNEQQTGESMTGNMDMSTTRLNYNAPSEVGVTVHFCVHRGKLRIYASSTIPNPSKALYDFTATITAKDIRRCATIYSNSVLPRNLICPSAGRKRRQSDQLSTIYFTIEGLSASNVFTINSTYGNVTYDVNECEDELYPCGENEDCYNTDGSYYCQCKYGYTENGQECTGKSLLLAVIIASSTVSGLLLMVIPIVLLIAIISICKRNIYRTKQLKISRRVNPSNRKYAMNPYSSES